MKLKPKSSGPGMKAKGMVIPVEIGSARERTAVLYAASSVMSACRSPGVLLACSKARRITGTLHIDMSALAFEDVVISCLACNQQVSDRVYMDPSWLLIVIQLTPQRWGSYEAPSSSLTLVSPDNDYRSLVFRGFRCVEVAVRADLVEEIGLGDWLGLAIPRGIFSLPPLVTRIVEQWMT